MKTFLLIFLLFAAPAIAADVGAPPPDARAAMLKAVLAIEHAKAAIQVAIDAQGAAAPVARAGAVAPAPVPAAPTAPSHLDSNQPPAPVVPALTADAAPVVVQGPIETKVSIPAQIQTDLLSLASIIITGMIGLALKWMRSHLKIMQDVGMNQQVTTSAEGFGALLVQQLKQQGIPAAIDINNPKVAEFTQKVLNNYSDYVAALGMTPDKVATIILKGAAKVLPATNQIPTKPAINIVQAPTVAAST